MTMPRPTLVLLTALISTVVAIMLVSVAPAIAAGIEIAVGAPAEVTIGQSVEVKAVLSNGGAPVEGAEVALTYQASLSGESARVEIATATTDGGGIATLTYEQRADDNGEMQVVYLGPEGDQVEPYVFTIAVVGESVQLYQLSTGVRIPFINGTLVILVISSVWFLIAMAAVYLVRVGIAGRPNRAIADEDGSMWISVILAAVAVITAAGMVIVFIRAPVANSHVTDPEGYDRTIVNYLDVTYPYDGFGLNDESLANTGDPIADGEVLYFQFACAACHGLGGRGAIVAPELIDELGSIGSFTTEVREGPKGMPLYDEGTISNENVEKIYAYLDAGG
jgi:hypothetical protein